MRDFYEQAFLLRNSTIKQRCWEAIKGLSRDGNLLEVIVRPYRQHRSIGQNRRYWLLVNVIADDTGNDPQYLHEMLKLRFLGAVEVVVAGQSFTVPKSTTTLNIQTFGEYMTRVEAWAATELGCAIPAGAWYGYR
ncbi:hypothetical protein FNU76_01730 [Chitinimonas arctica]|uniref:NinB family protein n=1 Tax=Chitinimonas arctica TaxID=2594795 RepID=A0A516SAK1_9NEIS|nr:hypothetical protein [Chitinimonas arctica]QDQ25179.1 hypothetical protein FNU76_01730 [Chitinimonas arctica]